MRDATTQRLVKKAMADGVAFQRAHGTAPNIIIRRHHDHVNALFSPRQMSHSGWPMCLRCRHIVEGYGIDHDGALEVEVYAECHGEKTSHQIRKPRRDIMETEPSWISEVISLLTFFAPRESDK